MTTLATLLLLYLQEAFVAPLHPSLPGVDTRSG